jgi:hypothetical protein
MEYNCRNSRNDKPKSIFLGDLTMRIHSPGKDEIVHYSSVQSVHILKGSDGFYAIELKTIDKNIYTLSNRYFHPSGEIEDKSASYSLFVRVLHMHLREKSKAQFKCVKNIHVPEWQKLLLVVVLFAICYLLDYLGYKLFHPAVHGIALSGIALLLVTISEKNRSFENFMRGDIPPDFLPG